MIEIRINTVGKKEWDLFVQKNQSSTYAHLYGWKEVVESAYGHEAFYYEAWEQSELVGVVPAFLIKSRLFGRQLVSMPYLDSGGPLSCSVKHAKEIIQVMIKDAAKRGADINLRSITKVPIDFDLNQNKVSMHLKLENDPEITFKQFSPERRNRIKKGRKNGLRATFHKEKALDEFYAVFSENMRDLGSPVHSKKFFVEIMKEFQDRAGLIMVRDSSDKAIGGGLYFQYNNLLALPWVSSLRDYFKLNPNISLYWELIKWGCENNIDFFDFGRSSVNSGTYEFKRQWGAKAVQLFWYSHSCNGGKSIEAMNTDANRNQIMINLWKKLPLEIANIIGPKLRKSITL